MAKASTNGMMEANTMASGLQIRSTGLDIMCGQTVGLTLANGKRTICMGRELTRGRMAASTKVNT